jgi:hypothetical protein
VPRHDASLVIGPGFRRGAAAGSAAVGHPKSHSSLVGCAGVAEVVVYAVTPAAWSIIGPPAPVRRRCLHIASRPTLAVHRQVGQLHPSPVRERRPEALKEQEGFVPPWTSRRPGCIPHRLSLLLIPHAAAGVGDGVDQRRIHHPYGLTAHQPELCKGVPVGGGDDVVLPAIVPYCVDCIAALAY